jgi:hypothetical protein
MGRIEEAVQPMIQEFEFFQDAFLVLPVLLMEVGFALASDVLGVAAEGGRTEAKFRGQFAVWDTGPQAAIDFNRGFMGTDRTAFYHRLAL